MQEKTRQILLALRSSEGKTVQELSIAARMNRQTATKYLAILEAKGLVKCRQSGKSKLYQENFKRLIDGIA